MPHEELRRSPELATELLAEMLEQDGFSHAASVRSRTIHRLNMDSPYAWELTLSPGMARLNVGQDAMAEIFAGILSLYCLGEQRVQSRGFERRQFAGYSDITGVVERWFVDSAHLAEISEEFLQSHFRAVAAAANAKQRSPFKRFHSPSAVIAIARAVGVAPVQPAYFEPEQPFANPDLSSSSRGSTAPPDPVIEQAAVDAAFAHYRKRGWWVTSVEHERCGYDLLCQKAGKSLHVEVKGLSGALGSFILTANEMHCAMIDPHFELFVLSEIRSPSPKQDIFRAKALLEEFVAVPTAYSLQRRP